jgi:5'-deoxynucleotidase YfbR-like HD superfamily hydrolase
MNIFLNPTKSVKNFEDIKPADVNIHDIAKSLSLQVRYCGVTHQHYTVAEHSVILSGMFTTNISQRFALLHDAHESYCGDVIRPVLAHTEYFGMENLTRMLDKRIYAKFNMQACQNEDIIRKVKDMDDFLLYIEAFHFFNTNEIKNYESIAGVVDEVMGNIKCYSSAKAEKFFLEAFNVIFDRNVPVE